MKWKAIDSESALTHTKSMQNYSQVVHFSLLYANMHAIEIAEF